MSKWEKLLMRIQKLSNDLRFQELRRVLESYGYEMRAPKMEAVIIHSGRKDVCLLQFQNMNQ